MKKLNIKVDLDAKALKSKMGIKDGYTPIKNVDYFDGKDAVVDEASIALKASTMAQEALKTLIPTVQQLEQNIPVLGDKIRDSLELLNGDERLDKDAIRGLDDYDEISRLARQPKVQKIYNGGGGGVRTFTGLDDTPNTYSGQAGKYPKVKVTEDGLEFGTITPPSTPSLQQVTDVGATTTNAITALDLTSSNQTASTIASFDASKKIISLDTATYPSLTELSYGKGVTSAIQTQLDAKQATLVSGTNIKTINGSTVLGSGDLTVSGTMAIGGAITSGTAGSVLFGGTSGVLQQDNTNFFWDDTNNRLGLGKNNPSYTLDLVSSGNIQAWIGSAGSSFGYTIGRSTSNGFLEIFGNQGIFSGISVDQIRSAGAITIAGNAVISNWATTLGLGSGSGSPSGVLEIRGTQAVQMAIGGGNNYNYNFVRNSGTGFFEITGQQSGYTGYIISTANGANALTINDGGSTGMGVAIGSIGAKLHVVSTTEQSRVGYDASNYYSTTVGSTGGVTFNAVGSGSAFTFSDPVNINGLLTLSAQNIATDTTTGMKIGTGTTQKLGFWNTTPDVQPTTAITASAFVANTSLIFDDSATYGGYTMGQVVASLKRAGLLA